MDQRHGNRLFVGGITEEDFIRSYWRRTPLFVKNGASDIIGRSITEQAFDRAVTELKATGTGRVRERGSDVTFVEDLSAHMPELRPLAARYAALLGVPTAWFDGVRIHTRGGIGGHFDHSDNFVLQQAGVKIWKLSPPDALPVADRARRMLGAPDVGAVSVDADNALHFELEPGDFLYLPLLWAHSGVSESPSLSLSLVCPAISFHELLLTSLRHVMAERLIGHQPVPSGHPFFTDDERAAHRATLRNVTRALLRKMSSEDSLSAIVDSQISYLRPGTD